MSYDSGGCCWRCAFCTATIPSIAANSLPSCPFCRKTQPGHHAEPIPNPSQSPAPASARSPPGSQTSDQSATLSDTGAMGGGDSLTQFKEDQRSGQQVVLTQQQMQEMQRIEETRGPQQPLGQEQQQLLQYQQQLDEKQRMSHMLKQHYEQELQRLRTMEWNSHRQQLGPDQIQQLMGQRTLCQQLGNDLQVVSKQQQDLWHRFVMLGGISEQQRLLEYDQQLVGIERQLKQYYEQEVQRLKYLESISSTQQLGPDQQQQLLGQRVLCQQIWDDQLIALKRRQELQHKFMLGRESGLQTSSQHQRMTLQGGRWVPEGHDQLQHNQQGLQQGMVLLGGQWVSVGHDQQQLGQAPQHVLGADNNQWSGGDQQQEDEQRRLQLEQRRLQQQKEREVLQHTSSLGTQQKEIKEEQKESKEEGVQLKQQKTLQQQQQGVNGEQLHKQQQQMPQDQGGHDQQMRDGQQRHHEQQQRMEQLRSLQEKLKQILQQQQQLAEEGGQQPNHDQQKQNEQELQMLQQQIRLLEQQMLEQQGEDGQWLSHEQHEQQQQSDSQQGHCEQKQGMQQQQQETQHGSQQPIDGQHQPADNEDVRNVQNLTRMWEKISQQEQEKVRQEQLRMQQHRQELEQQRRREEQLKEGEQMEQSQQEGQSDSSDGIDVCECGTPFHPHGRVCPNPNCGKPRRKNQPQGPPCVHCHKPLIKEGAIKCGSCNKKQSETPAKPAEVGGTGVPPPPGLGHGYGYSNPPHQQPAGVQTQSSTEMVASPATLPNVSQSAMVFGKTATIMTSVKLYQPTTSQFHPPGKEDLSAASDNPSAMMPPNGQQQQASSTCVPLGYPAAGASGALPSNQGNDGAENQTVVRQTPPSTKDHSAGGQHSAMVPCTTDPLREDAATQSQAYVSNEQKQTTLLDNNNNQRTTSGANSEPGNRTAGTGGTGRPPESQSANKSENGIAPDPPITTDDPATRENSQNAGKTLKREGATNSTSDNQRSYASVTGQKVSKESRNTSFIIALEGVGWEWMNSAVWSCACIARGDEYMCLCS